MEFIILEVFSFYINFKEKKYEYGKCFNIFREVVENLLKVEI